MNCADFITQCCSRVSCCPKSRRPRVSKSTLLSVNGRWPAPESENTNSHLRGSAILQLEDEVTYLDLYQRLPGFDAPFVKYENLQSGFFVDDTGQYLFSPDKRGRMSSGTYSKIFKVCARAARQRRVENRRGDEERRSREYVESVYGYDNAGNESSHGEEGDHQEREHQEREEYSPLTEAQEEDHQE